MPKSTKRIIINTSGLNSQGFCVLTDGIDLSGFQKNPVMLFNHVRPSGTDKNQILPIGHWEDIEVNGDELSAVPVFDDKDDFAMSIYNKVEAGHLRMASIGTMPIEVSDDPALMVQGQTLPTVTKSLMKEASIVDIGANPDALDVALYDANGSMIKLADQLPAYFLTINKSEMKNKPTAAQIAAARKVIELADKNSSKYIPSKAPSADALKEAQKVIALAEGKDEPDGDEGADGEGDDDKKLSDDEKDTAIKNLQDENARLADEVEQLKAKLAEGDKANAEAKATELAEKAVRDRKIAPSQKASYIALALKDFANTEKIINAMSVQRKASDIGNGRDGSGAPKDKTQERLTKLADKSFDELFHSSGDLDFVRLNDPDRYKEIYKEKFGKEPKNV